MKSLVLLMLAFGIADAKSFTLMSDEYGGKVSKKQLFSGFGCNGDNISPELSWANAPSNAKSFAIVLFDPDSRGNGWWHWIVYDIPKTISSIPSNASTLKTLPKGSIEGMTSFGFKNYGGPCPPRGDGPHRYIITLYALDVEKLNVSSDADPKIIAQYIESHTIQKSSIVSHFERE
jgi:Raf kinase inhibitor-like YbhB/YbcL family protein